METRVLRYFLAVAREQPFSLAATKFIEHIRESL